MDRFIEYASHHPWLVGLAIAAAAAVLGYELWLQAQNVAAIAPQEAIRLMNQGATVLDLRPAQAYAAGHIGGARSVPAAQLPTVGDSLKRYKERPLIVCCERGNSGAAAVRQLAAQGFTKVVNLRGGLTAWRAENLPLTRD
ncbi:MAG: rhodanese-like domain-containing protein [Steroidobacterales bacterium]